MCRRPAILGDTLAILLQIHASTDFLEFVCQAGTPVSDRMRPPEGPCDYEALYRIAVATGTPVIGPPMSAEEIATIIRMAEG